MMKNAENLTIYPELALVSLAGGDLLSQVLARIRLTGESVYATTFPAAGRLDLVAQTAHVCVVNEGIIEVSGEVSAPVTLQSGDLVLLPRGPRDLKLTVGERPAAVVVCRFWFDPDTLQEMLFALPTLIHIRQAEASHWLANIIQFLLREAGDSQPGSALMISRMIDLIVIRTSDLGSPRRRVELAWRLGGCAYRAGLEVNPRAAGTAADYRCPRCHSGHVPVELLRTLCRPRWSVTLALPQRVPLDSGPEPVGQRHFACRRS
jgi:hypothetical protein